MAPIYVICWAAKHSRQTGMVEIYFTSFDAAARYLREVKGATSNNGAAWSWENAQFRWNVQLMAHMPMDD